MPQENTLGDVDQRICPMVCPGGVEPDHDDGSTDG